jgi:RNA polymerase sigma-70 factor (ECF subfamily)
VEAKRVEERAGVPPLPDPRTADVAALVRSVQRGHRPAFAALYAAFHRAVHAVLLARVPSQDARDLVQDVFAHAFEKIADLTEPAAFPGWLLTMARNRATDHLRRARRFVSLGPQLTPDPGARDAHPAREVVDAAIEPPPRVEATEALNALRALPDAYRETLIMRLVEGMTGPEIAARTGLTPDSVRVNLHRGMKLLRAQLGATDTAGNEEAS